MPAMARSCSAFHLCLALDPYHLPQIKSKKYTEPRTETRQDSKKDKGLGREERRKGTPLSRGQVAAAAAQPFLRRAAVPSWQPPWSPSSGSLTFFVRRPKRPLHHTLFSFLQIGVGVGLQLPSSAAAIRARDVQIHLHQAAAHGPFLRTSAAGPPLCRPWCAARRSGCWCGHAKGGGFPSPFPF
ncbi:hypothetical protein SESBI_42737 [Sesbania bispinosa]|nr:hypothetical protein SESBI_42737 [Sesbania bispinosa]